MVGRGAAARAHSAPPPRNGAARRLRGLTILLPVDALRRPAGRPGRAGALALLALAALGCQPPAAEEEVLGGDGVDACAVLVGRTIRWIVPYSAGGGYDVYSRLLKPFYEEALGARIVIENRSGAGGRLGARVLRDAEPDGRTLGILNGYALLVMGLAEGVSGLDPVEDFTLLGRLAVGDPIWVAAPPSGLRSMQDVLARGQRILVGANDVSGTGFVAASVPADLLGIDVSWVVGYPGTRESSLGLMRGEYDIGAFTFESIKDRVDAGELIPLLRISSVGFDSYPALADVPVLAGSDGLVARVARERGKDPAPSAARAAALAGIFDVGRLVAAPPGLDPELAACLSRRLAAVVRGPELRALAARAQRALDFADPATLTAQLEATRQERLSLAPVFRRHAQLARGGEADR